MFKKARIIIWILLIMGIGELCLAYGNYRNTQAFLDKAIKTHGTVTKIAGHIDSDGDYMYSPVITFTDRRGKEHTFESATSSNLPAFEEGDRIEVLYDPADFKTAQLNSFADLHLGTLILGIMGGLFTLISGGVLFSMHKRKQKIEWLKHNGQVVKAKVLSVDRNTNLKVNGQSPYVIVTQWQDPMGAIQVFRSDNIWFDPSQYVKDEIDVFIDPNNIKSYWVSLEQLPKVAA
ncbi:MAG: DUF3592 domain-containing protein [Candidatus Abawacabacteria bacterium]|nr:DUF3592 domain-containing protein [Candidatus Abawacabacteria bacterium]